MHWLNDNGGEEAAAEFMATLLASRRDDAARGLAYRLFRICENRKWVDLSRRYNSLIASWTGINLQAKGLEEGIQQRLVEN